MVDEERAVSEVKVDVSLGSEHNFYLGDSKAVEAGGVFIAASPPKAPGTEVRVDLGLPSGRRIEFQGVVAWRREHSPNPRGSRSGYGVKWAELPPWVFHEVSAFMGTRMPLRHFDWSP